MCEAGNLRPALPQCFTLLLLCCLFCNALRYLQTAVEVLRCSYLQNCVSSTPVFWRASHV